MYKLNRVGERGISLFNAIVGHYFTMFVTIYLHFCVDCGVHGSYNLLQMGWYS